MADNDIYNSKGQYESVVRRIKDGTYLKSTKAKYELQYPL